ncbi:pre-mRNA-splicing factor CWC22 homolog [Octopus vulgaris]|uniref:Pre-mRNA-splicing factor CWC22 homolog n=1 Tax=Octopus vulgaris TaxID=6645 RepID=A0AA36BT62_OCTVU|nr:pre-mRNA-splicing factor CWC22 homolog [Octopus vulgaris]
MMTLSRSSQGDSVKKDSRKRYIDTSDDNRSDRDRRDKKKYPDLSSSKRDRRENRDDRREAGSSSRSSRDHDSSDTLNRKSQDRDSASSDKGNLCKSLVDYAESDKEAKHDERYSKKKKKKKKKHSGKQAENDSDNSSEGPKPEKRRRLSTSSKKKKKSSKWSSDEEDVLPKKEQMHGASISQESSFKKGANKESSQLLKNRWDDKEKAESSYDWRKERNESVGEKDRVRSKWDFDTSDDDDDDDEDDDAGSSKVSESQSSKGLRSVVGELSKEKTSRWSSTKESADESDDTDGNDKDKHGKEQTDRSSSKDRESLFVSSEFSKEGSVEKLKRKGKLLETQEGWPKVLKISKEFSGKFSRREDLSSSRAETGSTVSESLKGQSSDSVDTRTGEQTELRDSLEGRDSQNDSPELETRAKERISLKGKQSPLGKIETPKDLEKGPHGKSSCHLPESGEVAGDQSRESKIGEKLNRKNEMEERVKDREGDGDLSKVSNSAKNDAAVSSKQKPQPESYGLERLKSSREAHGDKDKDDIHITDEDREKLQMKRKITSERCLEGKKQSLGELKETSKETVAESDKYGDLPSERSREQYTKGSGHDMEPLKKCRSPEKDGNIEEGSDSKGSSCSSEEKNVSEKHGRQREGLKLSRWDRDASEDSNKESGGLKDQYKKKSDSGDLSLEKEDLKNQQERGGSKERFKGRADSQNQQRERSDSESGHSERSDSRDQRHGRSSSKVHHVEGSDSESSHHDKSESEDQHSARSDSDHQSHDKSSSKKRDRDDSRSRRREREESSEPRKERDESKDRHQEKEDHSTKDWRRDRDSSRERRRNPDDSRERHYARDDSRERHRDRDSYDTKRSRDDSRERQKDRDDYGGRYRYRDQPRDNWRFRDNRRYQNDSRRGRFNFRGGFKYRDSSRERQRYRDDSRDYRRDRDNRKDSDRDSDKHQRHSSWRDRNRSSSPDRYRSKENSGRENKTRKSDTSSGGKRLNGSPDRHHSADSSPDHHRSNDEKTSSSAQKNQQREKRTTDLSDKTTSDPSVPKSSGSGETTTASSKPVNPSKDPTGAGILTTRTGGAYIPPARLKMMQTQITDKSSVAYQRLSWEALRKSINGHINKVNVTNIIGIVRDLFQENIVRGRGLLARSLLQAQIASPTFTHVYAALVAIINTKAHEVIALEILTLLLENPTNNSVEVAVGFLKECGQKLTEVSPRGVNAIFERLKNILHEGKLEMRTQYIIEVMFAVRKDGFKDHPAVIDELDLVLEADQFTHLLTLDDAVGGDDILNVFKQDDNFLENEEKYNLLKEEILNSSSDESSDESGDGSQSDSGSEGGGGGDDAEQTEQIIDKTETNLVALRCTIYLTIQSSVDFEECAHKLLKMDLKPGQEIELCNMILDCCAQERTYQKFFGLLAQRFCMVDKKYVDPFQQIFKQQYETIHRLDPDKFRNVAKFFAHLLHTDAISWQVMSCIKLSKEDTSSASRIFLKILFQELSEYMGLPKLNYRFKDPTLQPYFEGIMPRDVLKNTRFAINFFTTIGLGGLTDDLREHLKNMAKVALQQKQQEPSMNSPASGTEDSSSDSSSDSSDSSSDSSGNSSDSSSDSSDSTPADKAETTVKKKKVLTKKRPVAAKDGAGANSKSSSSHNNNKLVAVSNNISSKKKKKNQSSSSSSSGSSSSGSSSSSSSSSGSSSSDSSSSSSSDSDDSLSSSSSNGSSSNAGGKDEHTVDSSESSTDSGSSSDSSSSSSSSGSSSSSDTMRSTALDEKRRRDNSEATSSVNHKHRSREDHSSGRDAINGLNQQGYTTAGGSHRKESRLGPRETDERVTHLADTRDRNHERDHRPMEWSRNDSAGAPLPPPRNSRSGGGGGGSDDDDDEIDRSRRVRGGEKRGSRSGGGYVDRVGSYASSSSNTADQWDKNRRDWDRSQNRGYELDRFGDRGDRTDRYYDKDRNGDRSDRYYDKERNERESYRRNSDRGDGNGGRRDPRQKRYRNDYVNNSNNRRDSYIQKDRVGHGDRERTEKYRNRD